jgi:hypothetical protein
MKNGLQLNEKVIRLNAFLTIIVATFVLIFKNEWLALFLAFDFSLRGFTSVTSPFTHLSKLIVGLLKLPPILVYAPPKKFAAKVGLLFTFLIFIFTLIQWEILTILVSAVLIFCAFLEAFLKICVGCYVYDWLVVPLFFKSKQQKVR